MAKKVLTDAGIRAMELPSSGRVEIADSVSRGLSLRLTPAGVRTWSFKYKDRLTGKTERKTLGRFPDIPLSQARALADVYRVEIYRGNSPQAQFRSARRAERAAPSFHEVADRYLREDAEIHKKPSTVSYERSNLNAARAEWLGRKAKDISRQNVRDFLDKRAAEAPVGANRTLAVLSCLFTWAVEKGILETSPVIKVARPTKREKAKDRVLTPSETCLIWPLFDRLDAAMASAFRILLLTGQRPGQVVSMEISEVQKTIAGVVWQIPQAKRKDTRGNKRGPHIVPLSKQAAAILEQLIAAKPLKDNSPFVFASSRNPGNPIDRHSMSRALQRLILTMPKGRSDDIERLQRDRPTPHDFRRTVATGLAALSVPREDRLAVLDHSEGDVHDVHYDRHDRLREKRAALDLWATNLYQMLSVDYDRRASAEL